MARPYIQRKQLVVAGRAAAFVVASFMLVVGCRENDPSVIQIVAGGAGEQQLTFAPVASLAEYVELPNRGDELRVSLANYDLNCDGYSPNPDGGVLVVLTFLLPVGQHPIAGTYFWPGLPKGDKSTDADFELKTPVVMPVVRIGKRSIALLPGGNVDIQRLNLERQGEVVGVMRLEQSGGDGQPPTRLFGSFRARVCRTSMPSGTLGP